MIERHAPIFFYTAYILLTYLLFEFGPWPWPVDDFFNIRLYIFFSLFFLVSGYFISQYCPIPKLYTPFKTMRLLYILAFVCVIDLVIVSIARTGGILPDVIAGVADPSIVYGEYVYKSFNKGYWTYLEYINIFLTFTFYSFVLSAIYYWKEIDWKLKTLLVFVLVYYASIYISIGVSKGIATLMIPIPLIMIFLFISKKKVIAVGYYFKSIIFALILFAVFLTFFSKVQISRSGGEGLYGVFGPPLNIYANRMSDLPLGVSVAYESLTRYVCQGYYVLSEVLTINDADFVFGAGASLFLFNRIGSTFNTDNNYLVIMENNFGWGMTSLWHGLPAWLINGFGIFGSLIVVFVIGFLLGVLWKKIRRGPDYFDLGLFFLVNILLLYYPANNQVFQSAEGFVAFFMLLIIPIFIKVAVRR